MYRPVHLALSTSEKHIRDTHEAPKGLAEMLARKRREIHARAGKIRTDREEGGEDY